MTEFEPLPAKAIMRIRREAKGDGLDEVGCAWSVLAAQERLIIVELMRLLPGTYYMDPPDGGSVSIMEQLRRMADDAAKWRAQIALVTEDDFSAAWCVANDRQDHR